MKYLLYICIALLSISGIAQKKKEVPVNPYAEEARELVMDGNDYLVDNAFAKAESSFREAISLDPTSVPAKYNAGNNYYRNEKYEEGTAALVKASEVAQTKKEKHKAFHNLGNALYQQENFKGAVEAYKNALRNDPTDEETRYNLMLAKKEEEENGGGGGGGDDENQDENQDQDQNQDKEKNEENKDGDGEEKEGDEGEEKETDDEGEEKENEGEKKEDEDGKPQDKEKEQPGDKGDQEKEQPQQPKPQQGQLTPQQVRNLLEAMRNEEQKTQEKINARKQKGAKIKTEKDW